MQHICIASGPGIVHCMFVGVLFYSDWGKRGPHPFFHLRHVQGVERGGKKETKLLFNECVTKMIFLCWIYFPSYSTVKSIHSICIAFRCYADAKWTSMFAQALKSYAPIFFHFKYEYINVEQENNRIIETLETRVALVVLYFSFSCYVHSFSRIFFFMYFFYLSHTNPTPLLPLTYLSLSPFRLLVVYSNPPATVMTTESGIRPVEIAFAYEIKPKPSNFRSFLMHRDKKYLHRIEFDSNIFAMALINSPSCIKLMNMEY